MKFFYLSSFANENGVFEIHERDCKYIPRPYDRDYLGPFNTGNEATRKALTMKKNVGLCEHCCNSKNTSIILEVKN